MPKKFLRRWMPTPKKFRDTRCLSFLRPLMEEPNLFHLNRHSVSVAFFVGIFCAFLPIPGQTIIAACLALLFRCNLPISVALIWISNPLTIPPIFFLTFEFGRWLLNSPPMDFKIQLSLEWFSLQGKSIIAPLLVGSLTCGVFFGALGYFSIHQLWRWHVVRSWQNRKQRRDAVKKVDHS